MKIIATWNVNSLKMRLTQVIHWIQEHQPDILALQETKTIDENFPKQAFEEIDYHVTYSGQKTFNGTAIISKVPATSVMSCLPTFPEDPQKRFLAATFDRLRIMNVYVPNGASLDSDKFPYKLHWLEQLRLYAQAELKNQAYCIILGDFNIAPEDRDVYDPKVWEGQILVSNPERQALKTLMQTGFIDAFRLFDQPPKSYSWWDYRQLAFQRNHGLRLDLILASHSLVPHCKQCSTDKTTRKAEKPSDHAPVVLMVDV